MNYSGKYYDISLDVHFYISLSRISGEYIKTYNGWMVSITSDNVIYNIKNGVWIPSKTYGCIDIFI